jgi:hypothetical protein
MKKLLITSILFAIVGLTSCIKNDEVIFRGATVEFDAATYNANAAGLTYPIMTRVPAYGAASTTSNSPALSRTSGEIKLRVNLVGAQRTTETRVTYQVDAAASTAVAGTHFTALSGSTTIPANSSFGFITVNILNPGATTGTRDLVLTITDSEAYTANVNYAKLGLRIAQQ